MISSAEAVEVRAAYLAPPRSTWEPMLKAIKKGDSKASVMKRLPADAKLGPGAGSGGGYSQMYQLDGLWMLECGFIHKDDTVIACSLIESMEDVWVDPPKNFTGVWTTYQMNGQRSHEIHYKNGTYDGTFTSFHPNGAVAVVQTYGPLGIDGEDIGYFPSGKVSYRGRYTQGKQVGIWTWYDENGKVTSTKNHDQAP